MLEKIKNFFIFLKSAWSGGFRGKAGLLLSIFALFMFIRIFIGEVNVQKFFINIWQFNKEQVLLEQEQKKLNEYEHHINLIQNYSPDYVEELGLKYLNIGDPKTKILKL